MALAAHTIVIGATMENRIKGRQADALLAAYYGSEVALRLVQPGNENIAVTDAVQKVSDTFKCKPISGMLSHQTKQYQMDGGKTIIQNPTDIQRKEHEKCEFLVHEVYAIDVLITTGDGKVNNFLIFFFLSILMLLLVIFLIFFSLVYFHLNIYQITIFFNHIIYRQEKWIQRQPFIEKLMKIIS